MAATFTTPLVLPRPTRLRESSQPRRAVAKSAASSAVGRPGWLERLAAWAETQPAHRRLGSWTVDA